METMETITTAMTTAITSLGTLLMCDKEVIEV